MRMVLAGFVLSLCLFSFGEDTLEKQIRNLGNPSFAKRNAAEAALTKAEPHLVIPLLRTTVKTTDDSEIRVRAENLLNHLTSKVKWDSFIHTVATRIAGHPRILELVKEHQRLKALCTPEQEAVLKASAKKLDENFHARNNAVHRLYIDSTDAVFTDIKEAIAVHQKALKEPVAVLTKLTGAKPETITTEEIPIRIYDLLPSPEMLARLKANELTQVTGTYVFPYEVDGQVYVLRLVADSGEISLRHGNKTALASVGLSHNDFPTDARLPDGTDLDLLEFPKLSIDDVSLSHFNLWSNSYARVSGSYAGFQEMNLKKLVEAYLQEFERMNNLDLNLRNLLNRKTLRIETNERFIFVRILDRPSIRDEE